MDWLYEEIWGNELWRYLLVLALIGLAVFVGMVVKFFLKRWSAREEVSGHAIMASGLMAIAESSIFLCFSIGQNLAFDLTPFPEGVDSFQEVASDLITLMAITRLAWQLIRIPEAWMRVIASRDGSTLNSMIAPMVRNSLRAVVVVLALLQGIQIISNQDFTTILAGLGVGAAALALASQQSVSNFFGAIVLFVNRPFDMGDRIVYAGSDGTVEEVGIMCTKQRSLEGHLVTIPNGKLSGDVIRNISKRPNLRQIHNFTITYDTPPAKIRRAVEIVQELLDNHEGMHESLPPKVFFNEMKADSLNIFCIFWYHPVDWWAFNAFNQSLLLSVFERFAEEGIDFAFPSQTVYLAGDKRRPLQVDDINLKGLPPEVQEMMKKDDGATPST
ncbi:mechanosensitive ion channel [Ruficoccus amylovorans]|uniref:Mechanosensitive ion channel n=1 Tax=Ruficoccus amylovorans TaxID=1804625 RepID=A0A842HD68_9BACT|nr:mechanosensitive ion channel domain-containing protein [Ruficoccus amylovorans]MBC2594443.1 mechanosensitive ion channel [Ruficoccus amylovorans]